MVDDMATPPVLWTVGHSNHELDAFMGLIEVAEADFMIDVRSYPYSRFAPHFNRESLQTEVTRRGMKYLFLGESLGGRPSRNEHYDGEGHALYGPMADEPAFGAAITRLLDGAQNHRLLLVCSCGQPVACHRRLLVGKVLCESGAELQHILPDGTVGRESTVVLTDSRHQDSLFGNDDQPWRSAQSVSHRQRLSTSSHG